MHALLSWRLTRPVFRFGCRTLAGPLGDLRIGTQRPGHLNTLCWIVVLIFRGDDFGWCDALFGPSFQGCKDVTVDVVRGAEVQHVSKEVGPGSASAVHHARDHEQSVKVFGLGEASHLCGYALVVVDRVM